MLRVQEIKFTDERGQTYLIKKNQIETFPLQGGEEANMISTKVWNQHGSTPINALMETFEGELVFIIHTATLEPNEIQEARRKITNICNPLNGIVKMTIKLNNGETYNRDITFTSAPSFPVGRENRNRTWQKVQLFYAANNPFWYAEEEIVESFQGVEPLFAFPFELGGKDAFVIEGRYEGKVAGSTTNNANIIKYAYAANLPTTFDTLTEISQASYDAMAMDGGVRSWLSTSTSGNRPIFLFRYNILAVLEESFGAGIWNGATAIADKIALANSYITKMTFYQKGYGVKEATTTYQANLGMFTPAAGTWATYNYNWTSETLAGIYTTTEDKIDASGYATFALFMDASDGTKNTLYCTYAYCKIEATIDNLVDVITFGNVIPSKIATNEGQVEAPVQIEINGACINPRIENETTGEFIAFKDLTMEAGDELIIDTTFGQKKVLLNGQNVFNKLDFASTFFNLAIGENSIDFTDETGATDTTIHFIYRNLYITI